ncbi:MAG: diguanylate cyclase [Myxococcota bacterium]|jgi:predicted Fe-Mo cluster-binding NifX family protein|nr:diguanylate cyclase [Myxococcota bacterium]
MRVCIPVEQDLGLASPLCPHFGGAPLLLVVDTETGQCQPLVNKSSGHGMCGAVTVLQSASVEALIVGGIGAGAIAKLAAIDIKVYATTCATVDEALAALERSELKRVDASQACGQHGHGHDHGCGH